MISCEHFIYIPTNESKKSSSLGPKNPYSFYTSAVAVVSTSSALLIATVLTVITVLPTATVFSPSTACLFSSFLLWRRLLPGAVPAGSSLLGYKKMPSYDVVTKKETVRNSKETQEVSTLLKVYVQSLVISSLFGITSRTPDLDEFDLGAL